MLIIAIQILLIVPFVLYVAGKLMRIENKNFSFATCVILSIVGWFGALTIVYVLTYFLVDIDFPTLLQLFFVGGDGLLVNWLAVVLLLVLILRRSFIPEQKEESMEKLLTTKAVAPKKKLVPKKTAKKK
jgi:hypothetical protein